MDLDEEILAKGPPSRIINACGDGSLLADYSCSNPPVPLCHSTPIDSTKSELKVVTDAGKSGEGSIFNTAPLCCGKKYFLVEEQNEESMEEEVHGLVELSDDSIQSDNDLSSELKKSDETETETEEKDSKEPALELDEPSGSTQRYWFRERKPKSKKFGIIPPKVTRIRKNKKYGKKKKKTAKKIRSIQAVMQEPVIEEPIIQEPVIQRAFFQPENNIHMNDPDDSNENVLRIAI